MAAHLASRAVVVLLLTGGCAAGVGAQPMQQAGSATAASGSRIDGLQLPANAAERLRTALSARRYAEAEAVLIPLVTGAPPTALTHARLVYLGGIYSLANDALATAVALKKAEAIAPLEPPVRFSLAMAYVHIGHRDWAAGELRSLSTLQPKDPVYPYWLGRLEFDAQQYDAAIAQFKAALLLDPGMARAYDNLGLCYFQQNRNALAAEQFEKAIALERGAPHPSPWPFVNLGVAEAVGDQPEKAEANLRHALELDPRLAQAHFRLGNLLVNSGRLPEAVTEFTAAADDDATFAEPHVALARLYRRMGDATRSEQELAIFRRLHDAQVPEKPAAP